MQDFACKKTSAPCSINAQFDSCQANMVTSPFIGSFKNVPQTNPEQLVLDDMVHYAGGITPHHRVHECIKMVMKCNIMETCQGDIQVNQWTQSNTIIKPLPVYMVPC